MKFHCDRCKTRYSIADERVRGKILKIRCKNCSAVITVREGMDAPAADTPAAQPDTARPASRPVSKGSSSSPSVGGGLAASASSTSALHGAFAQAMQRPEPEVPPARPDISPSQSFRAPDHIAEEWYVSIDGEQFGPYDLSRAKEWIIARGHDDELFCWKEDFDDWLPVEKISHFRGLRARPDTTAKNSAAPPVPLAAANGTSTAPAAEPEPEALFDATMNRLASERAESDKSQGVNGTKSDGTTTGFEDDLELDIGEASRVVNLKHILPAAAMKAMDEDDPVAAPPTPAALPGVAKIANERIGVGTGPERAIGASLKPLSDGALADAKPSILSKGVAPHPKRPALLIPLLIGGAVVAAMIGVLVYVAMSGDDDGETRLARSSAGYDDLGRRVDRPTPIAVPGTRDEGPDKAATGSESGKTTRRKTTSRPKDTTPSGTSSNGRIDGPRIPGAPGQDGVRPLRPNDVINMSRKQGLGTRRCYERALKKDPFLDVKNMKVTLTVAASGVVTNVKLDRGGSSFLGSCLASRIRRWPFRKSTKGITMALTLTFEQQ